MKATLLIIATLCVLANSQRGNFNVIPPSSTIRAQIPVTGSASTATTGVVNAAGNNNNNNSPFGNNNNSPFNNNNNNDNNNNFNDSVINDHNRFQINDIVGTWAISAFGVAERPWVDLDGNMEKHPAWPKSVAMREVTVALVGLLCIDRRGKCSLEVLVSSAEESFIRESFGDNNCQVQIQGDGQGFVSAVLSSTAGCDRRNIFPNTLVMPFVIGENGDGFIDVTGCTFGIDDEPHDDETDGHGNKVMPKNKGKFRCMPAHDDEGGDSSSMAPLVMNGEMDRQNARRQNNNNDHKNDHGNNNNNSPFGNAPWDNSNNAQNNNNNNNDNNNNNNDEFQNLNNRQNQCERFNAFTLPFSLRRSEKTKEGFQAGCDVDFKHGECSHHHWDE